MHMLHTIEWIAPTDNKKTPVIVVRMAFYSDVWLNVTPNGYLYTIQLAIYICIFCAKVFLLISLQTVHFNGIFIKRLVFALWSSSVFASPALFGRFSSFVPFSSILLFHLILYVFFSRPQEDKQEKSHL